MAELYARQLLCAGAVFGDTYLRPSHAKWSLFSKTSVFTIQTTSKFQKQQFLQWKINMGDPRAPPKNQKNDAPHETTVLKADLRHLKARNRDL